MNRNEIYLYTTNIYLKKGIEVALNKTNISIKSINENIQLEHNEVIRNRTLIIDVSTKNLKFFFNWMAQNVNIFFCELIFLCKHDNIPDHKQSLYLMIDKGSPREIIIERIGMSVIRSRINKASIRETTICRSTLSAREIEIMRLYLIGIDIRIIEKLACIDRKTIYTHRINSLRKLGFPTLRSFISFYKDIDAFDAFSKLYIISPSRNS